MARSGNHEETIELTLSGTKTAGTVEKVGDMVGMYMNDGVNGDKVPFKVQGRIDAAPKVGSQAWTVGDKLYWDNGNTRFTKTAQGSEAIAVAAGVVGSGAGLTTGDVILLGIPDGGTEDFGTTGIKADVVAESTAAAGVTVDGVLLKDGGITLADAANLIVGSTTGTKIGTATTQKLGFWNATPIVQPAGAAQGALTDNSGGSGSTVPLVGNTMAGNEAANINNAHFAIVTLLHAIRTALVNAGIIKGAA
jgi:predicted RecA/RadA family phage recombinase